MEYPASKTRSLNIAFVVNADHLKRLAEILDEYSHTLEYTVKFTDDTSVRYRKVDEVIRQPNSNKRSIISLIVGPTEQSAKSAYMNLKKSGFPSLEYTINGPQRDVIYFADKLDDWSATVRQWYTPFISWAGAIPFLVLIGLSFYVVHRLAHSHPSVSSGNGVWLVVLVMFAVVALLLYVLKVLFPVGTFAVGHGEKRHRIITWIRNTVLVMSLSVVTGVIANWITRRP